VRVAAPVWLEDTAALLAAAAAALEGVIELPADDRVFVPDIAVVLLEDVDAELEEALEEEPMDVLLLILVLPANH
jgi:hypothetical protein